VVRVAPSATESRQSEGSYYSAIVSVGHGINQKNCVSNHVRLDRVQTAWTNCGNVYEIVISRRLLRLDFPENPKNNSHTEKTDGLRVQELKLFYILEVTVTGT